MVSAGDIIEAALRIAGVTLDAGRQQQNTSRGSEGLVTLNSLLGTMRTKRMLAYRVQFNDYVLTPGHNPHTIGLDNGSDFNQRRPINIRPAKLLYTTDPAQPLTLDLTILTYEQYSEIPTKYVQSSVPQALYYDGGSETGRIYLYPVPSVAHSVQLWTWEPLTTCESVGTLMEFPDGYQRALEFNLAVDLAPRYPKRSRQGDQIMFNQAAESMQAIKIANAVPLHVKSDTADRMGRQGSGVYDWRSDGYFR
jgi:hypothetical protein